MKNLDAVIFDMDGTLLDTLADLQAALNYSLRECGYAKRSLSEVQSYIGDGMNMLIVRALPDYIKEGTDSDNDKAEALKEACNRVWEKFRDFYIEHGEDNTRPYDGITELLSALKKRGIKTAVVSNKVQAAVERLNERQFAGLIDTAVGDGEGIKLKPEPDMILAALTRLGVDKENAVFVGDGDTDIIAAKRAEIDCISVSYGYRTEKFLKELGATAVAHSPKELAALLEVAI